MDKPSKVAPKIRINFVFQGTQSTAANSVNLQKSLAAECSELLAEAIARGEETICIEWASSETFRMFIKFMKNGTFTLPVKTELRDDMMPAIKGYVLGGLLKAKGFRQFCLRVIYEYYTPTLRAESSFLPVSTPSKSEYIPPSPESDEQGYYTASEGSQSQGYFTLESSPNHRATESNKVVASHGTSLTTPKFVPLAPAFQPNTTHDGSVDAPLAEDEKDTWYLCRPYDLFGNPFPPTSSTKVDNLAPFSAKLPSSLQAVFTAPLLNCRLRWSDLAYVRRHFRENDGLVRYLQDVLKTLWDDETIVDIGEARAEIQTMLDEHNRSTIALLNWTPCDCYVRPVEDYL